MNITLSIRYSFPSRDMFNAIRNILMKKDIVFRQGANWTTDAPYRETFKKIKVFTQEGVLSVDMEASSFFSIAKFRGVKIAGIFYAGDFVGGRKWDPRKTKKTLPHFEFGREKFFDLVLDISTAVK